jgi:SIR2-like domain
MTVEPTQPRTPTTTKATIRPTGTVDTICAQDAHGYDRAVVVTMFLLGAGASVGAGIPASRPMTREIVEHLTKDPVTSNRNMSQAINYVLAKATAAQTLEGGDAFETVDVERLFSTMQMLAERRTHEASPFVTWDPAIDQMDRAWGQPPDASDITRALDRVLLSPVGQAAPLAQAFTRFIDSYLGGADGALYRRIQDSMIQALREVVQVRGPVDYLAPIVTMQDWQSDLVVIASLNYDRTFEILTRKLEIPCSTGIEGWSQTGRLIRPTSGVFLLKLHGSIDWVFDTVRPEPGAPSSEIVIVADGPITGPYRRSALVFGERNKLTAEGPFLDLLAQFRQELERADRLVVVGYSFRDAHINEMIRRWVNGNTTRQVVVIDPEFPANDFQQELMRLLAPRALPGRPVVTPRITIIRKKAEEGLSEWAVATNREDSPP